MEKEQINALFMDHTATCTSRRAVCTVLDGITKEQLFWARLRALEDKVMTLRPPIGSIICCTSDIQELCTEDEDRIGWAEDMEYLTSEEATITDWVDECDLVIVDSGWIIPVCGIATVDGKHYDCYRGVIQPMHAGRRRGTRQ